MGGQSVVTHIGTGNLHNRNWPVIEMRRAPCPTQQRFGCPTKSYHVRDSVGLPVIYPLDRLIQLHQAVP